MYLLDTDTLSHLWQGNQSVKERLLETDDTEVAITAITKAEILRARCENLLKANGAAEILRAQRRFTRTEELLSALAVVSFEEPAAKQFDQLVKVKKLKRIGHADVLIASIALANSATLVTRNLKHFRQVPDLRVENWVD